MIFSGNESANLWKLINRINKKRSRKKRKRFAWRIKIAIYSLGCRCQELEALVNKLQASAAKAKK